MLYVWIGDGQETTRWPDRYFDNMYEDEWLEDPFVKEMARIVDKSEIVGPKLAYDYMGDPMPCTGLSGGVKTLILMYKMDGFIGYGDGMGENCADLLVEIGRRRDCFMNLTYPMPFGGTYRENGSCDLVIANRMINVKTSREYNNFFAEFWAETKGELEECPDDFGASMEWSKKIRL
jgi:hypothetical protein